MNLNKILSQTSDRISQQTLVRMWNEIFDPFFFFLDSDFGPGQLTSFHFIHSYEAGFYKPKTQLHPPICRITAHATIPGFLSTNEN